MDNLDIDPKCNCTWTSDILEWEAWREIPPWTYDFVWASPPCQQYSCARTTAKTPRNFALADAIVARTLEIIEHLEPKGWLMENPGTGLLKTRGVVGDCPLSPYVTACIPTELTTDTANPQIFGVVSLDSCLGPCVLGRFLANSHSQGVTPVMPKGSRTVDLTPRNLL